MIGWRVVSAGNSPRADKGESSPGCCVRQETESASDTGGLAQMGAGRALGRPEEARGQWVQQDFIQRSWCTWMGSL